MKTIRFFFAVAIVALMTGCWQITPEPESDCIYANDSSSKITIHFASKHIDDASFIILPGKSHFMLFLDRYDAVTVSNGKKMIKQTRDEQDDNPNNLFNRYNYITISEYDKNGRETILFVFDDSFFEDAEPIE